MIIKVYSVWNNEDDLSTHQNYFTSKKQAEMHEESFRNRFKQQGYYRNNRREKVALEDLDLEIKESQIDLKQYVRAEVNYHINEIFDDVHSYLNTESGDITPEQTLKLKSIENELSTLILNQVKQNI